MESKLISRYHLEKQLLALQHREDALQELSESIRRHGILQPLSVRRVSTGYELIAGERRLRAGIMAGLTEIPCIIMNMSDQESGMAAAAGSGFY